MIRLILSYFEAIRWNWNRTSDLSMSSIFKEIFGESWKTMSFMRLRKLEYLFIFVPKLNFFFFLLFFLFYTTPPRKTAHQFTSRWALFECFQVGFWKRGMKISRFRLLTKFFHGLILRRPRFLHTIHFPLALPLPPELSLGLPNLTPHPARRYPPPQGPPPPPKK